MPQNSRSPNAGGAANELGSLHRNGLAAVLASMGLSGTPIDGVDDQIPSTIAVETADAVDDIVCTMESGKRWYIQAKRSASASARRKTFEQWARQPLAEHDNLVLAVRNVSGLLAGAKRVLEQRRLGRIVPPSEADRRHFEAFEAEVRVECGERTDAILERAMIVAWEVDDPRDSRAESAATRLERVTSPGQGPAAFRTLQAFFQRQSASRTETGAAEWMQALVEAGHYIRPEGLGPTATIIDEELVSIATYRAQLASRLDTLDLAAISPEVPTLTVAGFAESIDVAFDTDDGRGSKAPLVRVLRRNHRFTLQGLPGSGKSEALRQMAAWLASQTDAPIPIFIRLREVAPFVGGIDDVTLDLFLNHAAGFGSSAQSCALVRALTRAVHSGRAVLLLDGLDETHEKRAMFTAGLGSMLPEADPALGVVISTRASSLDAMHVLKFPVVRVESPANRLTENTLIQAHAAISVPEAEREDWVDATTRSVRLYAETHTDIWRVPLLSTLATLRLIKGDRSAGTPAELLAGVVDDSVTKWERRRPQGEPQNSDPNLDGEMLRSGFAVIGRALNSDTTLQRNSAITLVVDALVRWSLSVPSTQRLADLIVTFWDETAAIFVEVDGVIQPRSRIFAELGDAQAALQLDSPEQQLVWFANCLANPSQFNAIALASGTDPAIAAQILGTANDSDSPHRGRALGWLAELSSKWKHLDLEATGIVLECFARAAKERLPFMGPESSVDFLGMRRSSEEMHDRNDGPGWRFAVELAGFPIERNLVTLKQELVHGIKFDEEREAILDALMLMSTHGSMAADDELIGSLERVLVFPRARASNDSSAERDRFGTVQIRPAGPPLLFGLDRVSLVAAKYASQLSSTAIENLWDLSGRFSSRVWERITSTLASFGVVQPANLGVHLPALSGVFRTDDYQLGWFLRSLRSKKSEGTIHPTERWRLTSLADFVDFVQINQLALWEWREACKLPEATLSAVLSAAIRCSGLDAVAIHLEASDLLTLNPDEEEQLSWYLHTNRLVAVPRTHLPIDEEDAKTLIPIVASKARWSGDVARNILIHQSFESVVGLARTAEPANWHCEYNLALVRLCNSSRPLDDARHLLEEGTGARAGAALYLAAEGTSNNEALLERARQDKDATVRDIAGAELSVVLAADYWTCRQCFTENSVSVYVCDRCEHSSANTLRSHKNIREYVKTVEQNRSSEG